MAEESIVREIKDNNLVGLVESGFEIIRTHKGEPVSEGVVNRLRRPTSFREYLGIVKPTAYRVESVDVDKEPGIFQFFSVRFYDTAT